MKTRGKIRLFIFVFIAFFFLCLFLELGFVARSALRPLLQGADSLAAHGGEYRIMVLGDSISAGYPSQLERILSDSQPTIHFRIVDLSSPALISDSARLSLNQNLKLYKPDLVLVMVGKADAPYGRAFAPEWSALRRWLAGLHVFRLALMEGEELRLPWLALQTFFGPEASEDTYDEFALHENLPALSNKELSELDQFKKARKAECAGRLEEALATYQSLTSLWRSAPPSIPMAPLEAVANAKVATLLAQGKEPYFLRARRLLRTIDVTDSSRGLISRAYTALAKASPNPDDAQVAADLHQALRLDATNSWAWAELAWLHSRGARWTDAIEAFEALLRDGHSDQPALNGLAECYRHSGQQKHGIMFLRALLERTTSDDRTAVLGRLARLEVDVNQLPEAERDLAEIQRLEDPQRMRNYFLGKMYYFAKTGQLESLDHFFRNMTPAMNGPSPESTAENLRAIASTAQQSGAAVMVLQYPSNHVEWLFEVFAAAKTAPQIIDSRDALLAHARQSGRLINAYFQDDFEHLTPLGAEAIAQALANETRLLLRDSR